MVISEFNTLCSIRNSFVTCCSIRNKEIIDPAYAELLEFVIYDMTMVIDRLADKLECLHQDALGWWRFDGSCGMRQK
jgi:hypothetical protein